MDTERSGKIRSVPFAARPGDAPGQRRAPGVQDRKPEDPMNSIDLVQWPAMIVTVVAAWFVASTSRRRRSIGFWLFLLSNALWIVWGIHARAHALIALQVCLAVMNVRGELKNAR
jgi:hypothetical protein